MDTTSSRLLLIRTQILDLVDDLDQLRTDRAIAEIRARLRDCIDELDECGVLASVHV